MFQFAGSWWLVLAVVVLDTLFHLKEIDAGRTTTGHGDEAGHFALILQIRHNRHLPPRKFSYSVVRRERYRRYPFLYHWLLSFLPPSFVEVYGGLPALIARGIYLLVVGLSTWFVAGQLSTEFALQSLIGAFAVLIVSVNPLFRGLAKTSPFQFGLSPRNFGRLFTTVACLGLGYQLWNPAQWIGAAVSIAAVSLVALSSKFGMQATLGTFLGMALGLQTWVPVVLLLAGIGLAIIVSGGKYIEIAWGQIAHLSEYYRYVQACHPMTTGDFAFHPRHIWGLLRFGSPELRRLVRDPFLRQVSFWMPQNVTLLSVVGWMAFTGQWEILREPLTRILAAWLAVDVVLWLVIMTPKLIFLGEPDRYMEYSGNLPLVLLSSLILWRISPVDWRLVAIVLTLSYPLLYTYLATRALGLKLYRDRYNDSIHTSPWQPELDTLGKLPEGTVLTIPITLGHFIWGRVRRHQYVVNSFDSLHLTEFYDNAHYGLTDRRIDELIEKYGVDYLIVLNNNKALQHHDVSQHELVLRGPEAHIYRVRQPAEGSAPVHQLEEGRNETGCLQP